MKKMIVMMVPTVFLVIGCASVSVKAPTEPIKLDISMRLDVYQHVEKDIDAIEGLVSGAKGTPKGAQKQSRADIFTSIAYAAEGLSPEVEQAALRRQGRYDQLSGLEAGGIVGEDHAGMVKVVGKAGADTATLVAAENGDRGVIYNALAGKNGTSLDEIKRVYAKRLQKDAPVGTMIEIVGANGAYEWQKK